MRRLVGREQRGTHRPYGFRGAGGQTCDLTKRSVWACSQCPADAQPCATRIDWTRAAISTSAHVQLVRIGTWTSRRSTKGLHRAGRQRTDLGDPSVRPVSVALENPLGGALPFTKGERETLPNIEEDRFEKCILVRPIKKTTSIVA